MDTAFEIIIQYPFLLDLLKIDIRVRLTVQAVMPCKSQDISCQRFILFSAFVQVQIAAHCRKQFICLLGVHNVPVLWKHAPSKNCIAEKQKIRSLKSPEIWGWI